MSRTGPLYTLQQLELETESVSRRLKEVMARLGESAELRQARQQVRDAEVQLRQHHAHTQDLDLEVRGLAQRIAANEEKLYSGRVHNPKELKSLQEDTEADKRWQQKKEEELLEAMLAGEEAEERLRQARIHLSQVEASWQIAQRNLIEERQQLEAQLSQLEEQRVAWLSAIPAEDLDIYQALRQRKAGRPVAVVRNGLCEGCRMPPPTHQLSQAGAGKELIFCNNCGRILHVVQ